MSVFLCDSNLGVMSSEFLENSNFLPDLRRSVGWSILILENDFLSFFPPCFNCTFFSISFRSFYLSESSRANLIFTHGLIKIWNFLKFKTELKSSNLPPGVSKNYGLSRNLYRSWIFSIAYIKVYIVYIGILSYKGTSRYFNVSLIRLSDSLLVYYR